MDKTKIIRIKKGFDKAVNLDMNQCENGGIQPFNHFREDTKMIENAGKFPKQNGGN